MEAIKSINKQIQRPKKRLRDAEEEVTWAEHELQNEEKRQRGSNKVLKKLKRKHERSQRYLNKLKRKHDEAKNEVRKVRKWNELEANYWVLNPVIDQQAFNDSVDVARGNDSSMVDYGRISRTKKTSITSLEEVKQAVLKLISGVNKAYKIQVYIGVIASKVMVEEVQLDGEQEAKAMPYAWKNHLRSGKNLGNLETRN
jgi:hypothetical protein